MKYSGGGDWYANPTSLSNLIKYSNQTIHTKIKAKPGLVEPGSPDLFSYPFVHMTGHGNVVFNPSEVENIRNFLTSGGFYTLTIITEWMSLLEKKLKNFSK